MRGGIKVISENAVIYDNIPGVLHRISGTWKLQVESAELDIKEYHGKIVIDNVFSGAALNNTLGFNADRYSIVNFDGESYNFTSNTQMPLRTQTDIMGDRIRIYKNEKIAFCNFF